MDAMWKPQKFKAIYVWATMLPVYWAFGDSLLDQSNAFALLPNPRGKTWLLSLCLSIKYGLQ
ncbi:TMV resistance protein N [Artemisia annua]|uniref:TMV resistance protein N n=1 Tax=Artemisia annua TaxID=35608 RepID=A0A2U1PFS9_ARTAN|nr:TMV resistance protein N [Artemisia annua]